MALWIVVQLTSCTAVFFVILLFLGAVVAVVMILGAGPGKLECDCVSVCVCLYVCLLFIVLAAILFVHVYSIHSAVH